MKHRSMHRATSGLTALLVFAALFSLQPQVCRVAADEPAWSTPAIINDDGQATAHQEKPDVVVMDGLGIYVVWEDDRNDHDDIYFSRSTDSGVTWSANTQVNDDGLGLNEDPHVAVDTNGTIYVVWLVSVGEKGVYFAKSTNGGATWTASTKLAVWPSARGLS